jgi:hypothetical protein
MRNLLLLLVTTLIVQIVSGQDTLHFKRVPYKITINTVGHEHLQGYLQSVGDSTVYIAPIPLPFNGYGNNNVSTRAFKYEQISQVSLRRAGSTGRGILIGIISGAATGAAVGLISGDDRRKGAGWCIMCFSAGEKAAGLGVLFGFTGGLIGGIVGGAAHKTFVVKSKKEKFDEFKWSLIH